MKRVSVIFFSLIFIVSLGFPSTPKGYLFIIGGGRRPESMMKKFIELAERFRSGKIIIFPMASSVPNETGPEQVEQMKSYGAREVEYHILNREQALNEENAKILDNVGGVFFSGGV
ncbi:MAG: cyanophycinase, partial [Candidatus Aminicenantaceae bacterium]